jgi:4-amino-4-deoxy-L-arabinose transferase-like glycosyltransferase
MPRGKGKAKRRPSISELFKGDGYVLALWLLLLLAVFLVHYFYSGPYLQSGDGIYLTLAGQVGTHAFNPISSPRAYGWLFIYLSYLGQSVFGTSQSGLVALTAIEYLSLILLTYVLAVKVSKDRKLALLAAFIVCILPFTIQFSTRLLPDMLLGLVAASSAVFLLSDNKMDWALAGLMAGLMVYINLTALAYLIPFVICALASKGRKYVLVPLFFAVVAYTIPFAIYAHNPLFPFQSFAAATALSHGTFAGNLAALGVTAGLIQSGSGYTLYSLGLLPWLAALGSIIAIKLRDRRMLAMAGIFWVYLVYLCFGTTALAQYSVSPFLTRYLLVVAAPMAILVAYAIRSLAAPAKRSWLPAAIFIALLALTILSLWHSYHLVYYYNDMIKLNPLWLPAGNIV